MEHGAVEGIQQIAIMGHLVDVNVPVVISAITVSILLVIVAVLLGKTNVIPTGLQSLLEHVYAWLEGLAISLMGPIGKRYVPLCASIFLYVLFSNWIGLIPNFFEWIPGAQRFAPLLEPPTVSANVTLAMALVSFASFMGLGFARRIETSMQPAHGHGHAHGEDAHEEHGEHAGPVGGGPFVGAVRWILHYIEPVPSLGKSMEGLMKFVMVPLLLILFIFLNIVEELARILSLTFRLFGNIFGEHQVKLQLLTLAGTYAVQSATSAMAGAIGGAVGMGVMTIIMWGSLLFVLCLGTLAGFIQAFVFALLTMSYIAHAVADHH